MAQAVGVAVSLRSGSQLATTLAATFWVDIFSFSVFLAQAVGRLATTSLDRYFHHSFPVSSSFRFCERPPYMAISNEPADRRTGHSSQNQDP